MSRLLKQTITRIDSVTGEKTTRKSKKWYGEFRDERGVTRRVPLSTDKSAAQAMLSERLHSVERRRAGFEDDVTVEVMKPLGEHVAAFRVSLERRGNSAKHVSVTVARVEEIIASSRAVRLPDLTSARVEAFLGDQTSGGLSATTSNYYLAALKQFGKWLVQGRRSPSNPWGHLQKSKVTSLKRVRRAASIDELHKLLVATYDGKPFRLPGPDRAMLYVVAIQTGLRASELASLTVESFDLGGHRPVVRVAAAYSKNRKEVVQPLPISLADQLLPWLEAKQQKGIKHVWPGSWPNKAAEMLRRDLKAAGIKFEDGQKRRLDFHSLRHTFISCLALSGVHPKTAQALARHSRIGLTMDVYTHLDSDRLVEAVGQLPRFDAKPSLPAVPVERAVVVESTAEVVAKVTEQDTETVTAPVTGQVVDPCPAVSSAVAMVEEVGRKTETPNSLEGRELGVCCQPLSGDVPERLRPDSNRGWWICNPRDRLRRTSTGYETTVECGVAKFRLSCVSV
ncbi:MAG: site-specific integrase [Planctomycetaceae bacterium]|nr:site-specific integrase [Planctomycetaceae bacterium]